MASEGLSKQKNEGSEGVSSVDIWYKSSRQGK